MRPLLLLTTTSLLAGCRAPTVIPFDVVVRPKVSVDLETETVPAAGLPAELLWIGGVLLLIGLWLVVRPALSKKR